MTGMEDYCYFPHLHSSEIGPENESEEEREEQDLQKSWTPRFGR